MSIEVVSQVIGRAIVEPEFREALFGDPEAALAGFDLSAEESSALRGLSCEQFEAVEAELRQRIAWASVLSDATPSASAREAVAKELNSIFDFEE